MPSLVEISPNGYKEGKESIMMTDNRQICILEIKNRKKIKNKV